MNIHDVFHVDRFRHYKLSLEALGPRAPARPPPEIVMATRNGRSRTYWITARSTAFRDSTPNGRDIYWKEESMGA